jgi:hypothetical protein
MKKSIAILMPMIAFAMIATSCGGGESAKSTSQGTSSAETSTQGTSSAETSTQSAEASQTSDATDPAQTSDATDPAQTSDATDPTQTSDSIDSGSEESSVEESSEEEEGVTAQLRGIVEGEEDWANGIEMDVDDDGFATLTHHFNKEDKFKVVINESWDNEVNFLDAEIDEDIEGAFTTDEQWNIIIALSGTYTITVDTELHWMEIEGTIDAEQSEVTHTWGICGTFTGWGEIADEPLVADLEVEGKYTTNYTFLTDAEWKIRADNGWNVAYGWGSVISAPAFCFTSGSDGNIKVVEGGMYTVDFFSATGDITISHVAD